MLQYRWPQQAGVLTALFDIFVFLAWKKVIVVFPTNIHTIYYLLQSEQSEQIHLTSFHLTFSQPIQLIISTSRTFAIIEAGGFPVRMSIWHPANPGCVCWMKVANSWIVAVFTTHSVTVEVGNRIRIRQAAAPAIHNYFQIDSRVVLISLNITEFVFWGTGIWAAGVWGARSLGITGCFTRAIEVSGTMFAGVSGALWCEVCISMDGGATWGISVIGFLSNSAVTKLHWNNP